MSSVPPIASGRTAYGAAALQLLAATKAQVEQVARFQTQPRDFSAPRMSLASSLPAAPLAEMRTRFDVTA